MVIFHKGLTVKSLVSEIQLYRHLAIEDWNREAEAGFAWFKRPLGSYFL